jgi:hypothetical protein
MFGRSFGRAFGLYFGVYDWWAAAPSVISTDFDAIWPSKVDTWSATDGSHTVAGNVKVKTVGKGFYIAEGSNAKMGSATLVGGTVTVSTTAVTATSRILLTTNNPGGTPGAVYVSARVAGTSFTITSTSGTDTSDVVWAIFEPA